MRIDLSDGVLIEGTEDELRGLASDIKWVAKHGLATEGSVLTDEGVERVTIRLASPRKDVDR
jgi:hypothetical protein